MKAWSLIIAFVMFVAAAVVASAPAPACKFTPEGWEDLPCWQDGVSYPNFAAVPGPPVR